MSAVLPYSNTTSSARTESLYQNKMLTNYGVIGKSGDSHVILGNRTAEMNYDILELTRAALPKGVIAPTDLLVEYPARLKKAASVTIAGWTVVTEPATSTTPREDFPTCFSLQVRSTLSSTLDNATLNELWKHFISSLQRDDSTGLIDFRGYLLGALRPDHDNAEPT